MIECVFPKFTMQNGTILCVTTAVLYLTWEVSPACSLHHQNPDKLHSVEDLCKIYTLKYINFISASEYKLPNPTQPCSA